MSPFLYRLGLASARHPWRVVFGWLLAVLTVVVSNQVIGGTPTSDFSVPNVESQAALDLLSEELPSRAGASLRMVFAVPAGESILDEANADAIRASLEAMAAEPGVVAIIDPTTEEGASNVSPLGHIAYAEILYSTDMRNATAQDEAALLDAAVLAESAGVEVALGGQLAEDFDRDVETRQSEILGVSFAIIVLLVAFGSVIAMGLPIVTALIGVLTGLSLVSILSALIDIAAEGTMIATMIGIAVGIDYSLFVITRHRQHMAEGMPLLESIGRANATAGVAVVFAGGTVVIAIMGLSLVGVPFIASLGYGSAVLVAVAVMLAITLLPSLLGIAGQRIDSLKVPGLSVRVETGAGTSSTFSARWARMVSRRPWPFFLAGTALLGVLLIPVFSLELGQPDAGNNAPESTTRIAYDLLAEGFGPGFNGPLLVVAELPTPVEPGDGVIEEIAGGLSGYDEVVFASLTQLSDDGTVAAFVAIPASAPQEHATRELVHELRTGLLPGIEAETGAELMVTGSTAFFIDLSDRLMERLPVFIGAVLVLSFLLLAAVFRSLLVPLKAAILNLLGIGAAYGVVVAIFQWGWFKDVVGLDETVPIATFLPMMMFAIIFGLSMDYEVFILSRVREHWLAERDATGSVVHGIASSARVITAAALIMITVFASFILNESPTIKMFGVGLSMAVLLDATVVRMVLVPSTMVLLGERNWWLPKTLDRILPHLDIEPVDVPVSGRPQAV